MGDELLKKTGAGNLFMVFGEPDVEIKRRRRTASSSSRSGAWTSTTRPPARSAVSSTDDIACWFIDTDYNGESFFVRHAYFTGADEPYESSSGRCGPRSTKPPGAALYSHRRAAPSTSPTTGKIAVKVINHYGDEVLKVYEV